MRPAQVDIPTFVRIKPNALERLGIYARRHQRRYPMLLVSAGLPAQILDTAGHSFAAEGVELARQQEIDQNSFDAAEALLADLFNSWQLHPQAHRHPVSPLSK